MAPGREASGEIFRYESVAGSLDLIACGERIAVERWAIAPLLRSPAAISRLGTFHHFASCDVCRAGAPQPLADRLSGPEVLWGVTSLKALGLVFRGVAVSGRSLSEGLVELWRAAKWALCGRAAIIPRKIH